MAEEEEELERTSASQMMNDEAAWHMLGSASRDKADAYLDEQIKVARLEREKLAMASSRWPPTSTTARKCDPVSPTKRARR